VATRDSERVTIYAIDLVRTDVLATVPLQAEDMAWRGDELIVMDAAGALTQVALTGATQPIVIPPRDAWPEPVMDPDMVEAEELDVVRATHALAVVDGAVWLGYCAKGYYNDYDSCHSYHWMRVDPLDRDHLADAAPTGVPRWQLAPAPGYRVTRQASARQGDVDVGVDEHGRPLTGDTITCRHGDDVTVYPREGELMSLTAPQWLGRAQPLFRVASHCVAHNDLRCWIVFEGCEPSEPTPDRIVLGPEPWLVQLTDEGWVVRYDGTTLDTLVGDGVALAP